jgi:thiosulfate reductase cytochrome b subunit
VIYHEWGIIGGIIIPTPDNASSSHILLGFILIILGIAHMAIHAGQKKSGLIMKYPLKDFKEFLHSLFYLIGFAKREEQTGGERYNGRQRMVYLALVYMLGLSAISGVSMFIIDSDGFFMTMFKLTHILANIVIVLVLLFHLVI